ncbi:transposase [Streptomyces sp. CB02261]|uniref:transposase n=1 Tax=Streptomyces sp. CB02261 TaxID=1703940 RepID=UPI00093BF9D7
MPDVREKCGPPHAAGHRRLRAIESQPPTRPGQAAPSVEAGCKLSEGEWLSCYDEQEVTDPAKLDIDHMVPLAEPWEPMPGMLAMMAACSWARKEASIRCLLEHFGGDLLEALRGGALLLASKCRHGGDMDLFGSPDRLATYAGLAPAPRDSGNGSGDRHRPKRYHRRLQRALFLAAMSSITCCSESRRYYDRKRAEGKRHSQAVLALARRRVNVLWALLRDQRHYEPMPPAATAPQGFSSRKPDRR